MVDSTFRDRVYNLISQVPHGKVTTYGDLAALAGQANAPRIVGGIAHYGDINLPWHRLVNRFGGLASGFHGGRDVQAQLLAHEGVSCTNYIVDNFKEIRWDAKSVELPLLVIVGPTASGKTSLAIDIAKKYNGEIICADSRSIYKGADIGTAKPTPIEQEGILHWGLDLVKPGEYFSVSDFKKYADKKIIEIKSRGKLPILVGGTGLYIDSVVFDFQFSQQSNPIMRQKLQQLSLEDLQKYCIENEIALPNNFKNKRHLISAIERCGVTPIKSEKPSQNSIIVGITTNKQQLIYRIGLRAEQMIADGVIDEAKLLGDKYGWDNEAMRSNIYPLIHQYLDNKITLDEVTTKSISLDWRLAKRQLTWLRRNRFIHWFELIDAKKYLNNELAIRK